MIKSKLTMKTLDAYALGMVCERYQPQTESLLLTFVKVDRTPPAYFYKDGQTPPNHICNDGQILLCSIV